MKSLLTALMLLVMPLQANAITIINNSFEDITGMTDFGDFANGVPTGWSFSGNEVQVLESVPPFTLSGVDGLRYVEIFVSPDFGTLSQTVMGLSIGQEYELSFLWGNRLRGYDFTIEMGGSTFSTSGAGIVNMTTESFTFMATSTSHDLNIIWNDSGTDSVSGGALDAFSLTAVPIPAALPLFGAGLAGLGFIGWRRRSS